MWDSTLLVTASTIPMGGYTLAMTSIQFNSVNATRILIRIFVLEERHLRRTCRPTFRRQIQLEIVLNQFEKCRSKHRVGVVDLSINISLEDGYTGEIFHVGAFNPCSGFIRLPHEAGRGACASQFRLAST